MATQSTYYLDGPSLGSATVVYTDSALTVVAADGWYSDGTISRQQSSGVLLAQSTCGDCGTSYDYYLAEKYDCLDCGAGPIDPAYLVAFDSSLPAPSIGSFYLPPTGPDGFAYKLISTTTGSGGYILTVSFGSFGSCALSCSA